MEKLHDRMPVILHPEEFDEWLNPATGDRFIH
ncbi:MAG: SOS response-associated peptidase family protein [Balneolaceae bacterium]